MSEDRPAAAPPAARFWFVELAPGVTSLNFLTLLYAAFMAIGLLAFVGIGTPYVLNVYLGIPAEQQGQVTGDLAAWTEIALLLVFGPVGIIADRIGRTQVFSVGFIFMAISYALYPWAASLTGLTGYRVLYAIGVGAATAMLGTILTDYPAENSRGKAVALIGVLNGLGVIILAIVLGGLPTRFVNGGASAEEAGYYTHFIVAALCLVSAVVVGIGLKKGTVVKHEERPPVRELMVSGFAAARNPRIALAYACAFIARSDLVIVGTFVNLWGTSAGIAAGLDPAEASAKGRTLFVIASAAGLFWLPVMGVLLDRVNRVTGTMICMGLAALGFLFTDLIDDPLGGAALPVFALLGMGQMSAFIAATTLIGQEAPSASRGAVVGMFNISGAVGILFSAIVGGRLFDAIGPHAVFEMIGGLAVAVTLFAVWVRRKAPGPPPSGRGGFMVH